VQPRAEFNSCEIRGVGAGRITDLARPLHRLTATPRALPSARGSERVSQGVVIISASRCVTIRYKNPQNITRNVSRRDRGMRQPVTLTKHFD
jgi:hypothetical protein